MLASSRFSLAVNVRAPNMSKTIVISLIIYTLVVGYWVWTTRANKLSLILGIGCILSAAPIAYLVGGMLSRFDANTCYSGAVKEISKTMLDSSEENREELFGKLPLSGYETDCKALVKVVREHNQQYANVQK